MINKVLGFKLNQSVTGKDISGFAGYKGEKHEYSLGHYKNRRPYATGSIKSNGKRMNVQVVLKLGSFNPLPSVKDRIGIVMIEDAEKGVP